MRFRSFALLAAAVWAGCATEDNAGVIPDDQLYYPWGIAALQFGQANRLVVLSTNYDQRFASGQLTLLDADRLIDDLLTLLGGTDTSTSSLCPVDGRPLFIDSFNLGSGSAILGRARAPGIGTNLAVVGQGDVRRVYFTDRLTSSFVLVKVSQDGLSCRNLGEPSEDNIDCGLSHIFNSQAEGPFLVSVGSLTDSEGTRPFLAVGHHFSYDVVIDLAGVVTLYDEGRVAERAEQGLSVEEGFEAGFEMVGAGGIGGLGFASQGGSGSLLSLAREAGTRFEVQKLGFDSEDAVETQLRFDLNLFGGAFESTGLVALSDGERAVLSLRFRQPSVTRSSGLAVLATGEDRLESFPFLDVGEELGPPSLRPKRVDSDPELILMGDLATDKVFVIDVTRNSPAVVGELESRAPRLLPDGRVIDGRVFDGPQEFAFVQRGNRTFGFVTNFAGSTLTVVDVSSPNGREHCALARLGRDVDAEGESEATRE